MDPELPAGCQIHAWRPKGVQDISEVFHARIVDYGYPSHCHDTWTVLIVDRGAISYDLDRRQCGAAGDTVAILPPGVIHNGKPASGAPGFVKRVLYLDKSVLPIELVGPAVDRTNIEDRQLRRAISNLHQLLAADADPFEASSSVALIVERIAAHLQKHPQHAAEVEVGVAHQLRLILDEESIEAPSLDSAAATLGRSKAHLVRSFSAKFGVAPHAYLIGKRVEQARGLLLEGKRVAEVGATVGFYDQSHFTRHFKRHTSITPAAFASKARE